MSPPRLETAPGCFSDVPDNVIDLAAEEEAAFEHYAAKARDLVDNPKLLFDREFNVELERRRQRWLKLFHIREGGVR